MEDTHRASLPRRASGKWGSPKRGSGALLSVVMRARVSACMSQCIGLHEVTSGVVVADDPPRIQNVFGNLVDEYTNLFANLVAERARLPPGEY